MKNGQNRMKQNIVWFVALALAVVLSSACKPAGQDSSEPAIAFKDTFHAAPVAPWEWIRENPAGRRSDENGLYIKLEPGGLMGGGKDAKNILVRPLLEGTKSVIVCVDAVHKEQYEQAGLILYHGDDDYIKLVKEMVDGQMWVVYVVEIKAQAKVVNKVPWSEKSVWIGAVFNDGVVSASCWGDDGKFFVGKAEFPLSPLPRAGVFTQGGQAGADRWARFENFEISDTEPEIWSSIPTPAP